MIGQDLVSGSTRCKRQSISSAAAAQLFESFPLFFFMKLILPIQYNVSSDTPFHPKTQCCMPGNNKTKPKY
jgi:hypothetical protein